MENEIIDQSSSTHSQGEINERTCWICFGTDNDEFEGDKKWVSPCKCRGSGRWVHQDCVQRWIEEKLKQNSYFKAHCPQCRTEYTIVYKEVGLVVRFLNELDKRLNHICLRLGISSAVCGIYWIAVSYGAIAVIQVMGEQEALKMLKEMDPVKFILILPAIPYSLILGKSIDWKNTLMLWVQRITLQLPLLRTIMPSFLYEPAIISTNLFQYNSAAPTRTLCSALIFPTFASIVGNKLFGNSSYSYTKRSLLGGLLCITVRGLLKIYQEKNNDKKRRSLKAIDHPYSYIEENH